MVMGCYGIGVTRIAAAAIEQNHDKDGIVWPMPLAPVRGRAAALQQDDAERRRGRDTALRRADRGGHRGALRRSRRARRREVQGRRPASASRCGSPSARRASPRAWSRSSARRATEVRKLKIDEAVKLRGGRSGWRSDDDRSWRIDDSGRASA